jgi:FAD/FMN-containing dehydrogenase
MNDAQISAFGQSLRGQLIGRTHPEYDSARKLYNAMIDKRPLLIARCADVADVIAAVNFGRDNGLVIAVRGGGHNGPGLASVDDGLVIDLSQMKGVRTDPKTRTVRVAPGCTTGDVDHATHAYGLAVPTGTVASTGIAGLTLGGGIGYLSRQFGLTIDNLIEADVVLADGRVVTASETDNADLLWGLRGGGGNFGVVTSFLFRAHPVQMVYGGPMFWDIKDARTLMQRYRDFLPKAPAELGLFLGLQSVPPTDPFPREHWAKRICVVVFCYNGPKEEGEKALRPFLEGLPPSILNWVGMLPFPALQSMFDPLLPSGMQWYWRGDYVESLSDPAIEAHIVNAKDAPNPMSLMHLYPLNGAVHRVGKSDTPWTARDAALQMVIVGVDPSPENAKAITRWTKAYWEAVHPYNQGGNYVNFMMADEGEARVKAAYGPNYDRLVALKRRYDPNNLFRVNQNIKP